LLKKAEGHAAQAPALRERHPPFVNRHSMKFHTSTAAGLKPMLGDALITPDNVQKSVLF
jgi:hypothetical protein